MFFKRRRLWTFCTFVYYYLIVSGAVSWENQNATSKTNIQQIHREHNAEISIEKQMENELNSVSDLDEVCKRDLEIYANASSLFMECVVLHAKPLNFCERCVAKYVLASEAFTKIKNEHRCSRHLLRSDYLQVISKTNDFLKNLWNAGNCDNCFDTVKFNDTYALNEETRQFFQFYNQTKECFNNFSMVNITQASHSNDSLSPLCIKCKELYRKMYIQYTDLGSPSYLCVDVLEKMNVTLKIWSHDYHCNLHDKNKEAVIAISLFVCLLPIMFYLLAKWNGVKQYKQSLYR
ncbi:osteopetrosis-associated transmembrane protein 1-like [Anneissia japonica]|uniref:osteopetrosis-associated transmembrane protein 1-like n=1 Tax=Anneissia japonica TaxID=1529436 RepID=UPI001425ABC1|nr:osteopetrosis-associated transmembrane protein 1-like [Anneissia japonica]